MAQSRLPSLWGEKDDKDVFSSLHREVDRVFDEFTRHLPSFGFRGNGPGKLMPRTDVSETDKDIVVTAELPGVKEKDIDVAISDDMLTIKAEKKSEKEEKDKERHVVERSYGLFERSLRLPYACDSGKAEAKFENGVLTITLPKPAEKQIKTQKIEVKAA